MADLLVGMSGVRKCAVRRRDTEGVVQTPDRVFDDAESSMTRPRTSPRLKETKTELTMQKSPMSKERETRITDTDPRLLICTKMAWFCRDMSGDHHVREALLTDDSVNLTSDELQESGTAEDDVLMLSYDKNDRVEKAAQDEGHLADMIMCNDIFKTTVSEKNNEVENALKEHWDVKPGTECVDAVVESDVESDVEENEIKRTKNNDWAMDVAQNFNKALQQVSYPTTIMKV